MALLRLCRGDQVKHKIKMPMKMYMGVMKKRKKTEARKAEEERLSGVVTGKLGEITSSRKEKRRDKKKNKKAKAK